MKQVVIQKGQANAITVPHPAIEPGYVLVSVMSSCISAGTEMASVNMSSLPLWKRAMQQPQNVAKVMKMASDLGIKKTYKRVTGQLSAGSTTGYSNAGVVIGVGEGIDDISIGDRVACAGAQCAFHAEMVSVPRNLVVQVPDSVSFQHASCVTLGAIAMQGVRRALPTLGESFVVIGLGILGQLTVQILKANGCKVIGIDLDKERLHLAQQLGLDVALTVNQDLSEDVARLTHGIGADGVLITAATPSNQVISQAFSVTRKKGRVVLVGDVGLNLNRADFYAKEIDFYISCSYGPGRYDRNYEEKAVDYPVSYVRWTENRNMQEFLSLVSKKKVNMGPLIQKTFHIDDVEEAYESLKATEHRPLIVLLDYDGIELPKKSMVFANNVLTSCVKNDRVNLALVGAGGFAKGVHLPNIESLGKQLKLKAVVSRSGHNAISVVKQYGGEYATTDFNEAINDESIDAVLIATRHNLHASMVIDCLNKGKNILVEKPLCLTLEELAMISSIVESQPSSPLVLTGYNRRFSKYLTKIKDLTSSRVGPMIINYRMNAGYLSPEHWTQTKEGGGRNLGEACHIYDLFTFLANSKVVSTSANSIKSPIKYYLKNDNFVATFVFEDGSVATLTYTAMGAKNHPKERMDLYFDGRVVSLDDYKSLSIDNKNKPILTSNMSDKGQKEELQAFVQCIKEGGEWPIAWWQQKQVAKMAIDVENLLER